MDTTAKRLMSNYGKASAAQTRCASTLTAPKVASASQLNSIIFKDKAQASIPARFLSLFPGLGYAAVYKVSRIRHLGHESDAVQVLQRVYKYGGQPFVRDYLATNHGDSFDRTFGKGNGKALMHATAGR